MRAVERSRHGQDGAAADRAAQCGGNFFAIVLDAERVEAREGGFQSWRVHRIGGAMVAILLREFCRHFLP